MLLYRIVRQVHKQIVCLIQVVLLAGHSDVALLEVVALVFGCDHHPEPDVEFALVDKKGPLDVLLEHENVRFDAGGVGWLGLLGLGIVCMTGSLASIGVIATRGCLGPILIINCRLSSARSMQVIRMSKVLELFSLSAGCMLQDESLQLVNRIEKIDTAAPIRVSRLEKPHVVSIVQR